MDLVTGLTGILPFIVLVSAPLTALGSALLLWRYRRATQRAMGALSSGASAAPRGTPSVASAAIGAGQLSIGEETPTSQQDFTRSAYYRRTIRSERRLVVCYLAAGLAYALVLTVPWLVTAQGGFQPGRFLWLLVCYLWPTALALVLVVRPGRHRSALILGSYSALLGAVIVFALQRNPMLALGQLIYFWVFANGAGTLLLLTFAHRRIRSVGPLVLVFTVVGVSGAVLGVQLVGRHDALLRVLVAAGDAVGLGATALFVLLHVAGFLAFACLGWWLLRWIGRRYRAKKISDQSIIMDAVWLLFAVVQSITLAFEAWYWILSGVVGFAAYKLTFRVWQVLLPGRRRRDDQGPVLLLLRVFSLGPRSERFFASLSGRWRHGGAICMIAGPDLVTSTVEPHEFLDFVSGRHARQFVRDGTDLDHRLVAMDSHPDPDGRYRVSEFFCHADTWQMTMRALATRCDLVLMDLRSFSPANEGCLYELGQLLDTVSLDRVAFLVDESTDRAFLDETLLRLWQSVSAASPNRRDARPKIRLLASADPESRAVFGWLLGFLKTPAAA